jgi:hypothetical protein
VSTVLRLGSYLTVFALVSCPLFSGFLTSGVYLLILSRGVVLFRLLVGVFACPGAFRSHYGPGVDLASSRNQYQESSWGQSVAGA